MYNIMSSENSKSFTSSFPMLNTFITFSSLTAMDRISKAMLNNSDESGHLCFVPNLSKNTFNFALLIIMFAVGLSYLALIVLR